MNPKELHASLVEKGKEKARTAAYHTTMDRYRKQVRAAAIVEAINSGEGVGKSEQMALITPDYMEACKKSEASEEAAGIAAVEYEAARAWFEAWRTLEATKRAEMKLT